MDLYHLKRIAGLCGLSFILVYFHEAFRIFLIFLESIPYHLQGRFASWMGGDDIAHSVAIALVLIVTTMLYSSILLAAYWLVNRRYMLDSSSLVFGVWFMLAVVMTIGPKALAL